MVTTSPTLNWLRCVNVLQNGLTPKRFGLLPGAIGISIYLSLRQVKEKNTEKLSSVKLTQLRKWFVLNCLFVGEVTILNRVNDPCTVQLQRFLEKRGIQHPGVVFTLLSASINRQLLQF